MCHSAFYNFLNLISWYLEFYIWHYTSYHREYEKSFGIAKNTYLYMAISMLFDGKKWERDRMIDFIPIMSKDWFILQLR